MAAIRSKENKTERALRQLLHRRGFRFRKYCRQLPGNPDIVFPTEQVAVFVDGDYWHGRVLRERGEEALLVTIKNPNVDYWTAKFRRNVQRDDVATLALQRDGWSVLRFWESDVRRDTDGFARRVASAVLERRDALKRAALEKRLASEEPKPDFHPTKRTNKSRPQPSSEQAAHSPRGKSRK